MKSQGHTDVDPRQVDPVLRAKYDVRGPRYTSYPPATHFGPLDEAELYARYAARAAAADDPGISLYFHIPFCRSRCLFCGCHTVIHPKEELVASYVEAVEREMELSAPRIDARRVVRQVAFGGGTPNFLTTAQLERLLGAMRRIFCIDGAAELSVEVDPRTSTPEKLDLFLAHGFNRFSLGVQDFTPEVLSVVRRGQDLMQVEEVVSHLRGRGCESINFDLIYGLPEQTLATAVRNAAAVRALRPSRIALYSYAHVPWIHVHQKVLETRGLPAPDLKASLFLTMMDELIQSGYEHIGMDHYALSEDPLAVARRTRTLRRNFMGYTTGRGLDIVAFGASAIASVGASYAQNEKDVETYVRRIAAGELPVARGFLLSRDDEIRRELLIDLFCNCEADLGRLSRQFGIAAADYLREDLARLAPLAQDGLVCFDDEAIRVTERGRFFIRNVCMTFDRYLEKESSTRVYSRTV